MIDREHDLPVTKQAEILKIGRSIGAKRTFGTRLGLLDQQAHPITRS